MSVYAKFFAAIVSTLVMRWLGRHLGLDIAAIGLAPELEQIVGVGIDHAIIVMLALVDVAHAAFAGFWVWLLPNRQKPPPGPGWGAYP
jgi:ABC-type uncharacterized transport system permease subunit